MESVSAQPQAQAIVREDALRQLAEARKAEAKVEAKADTEASDEKASKPEAEPSDREASSILGENSRLSIERRKNSDGFIYRSIDRETGEVLREWPPERFQEFAEGEGASVGRSEGLVVDRKA